MICVFRLKDPGSRLRTDEHLTGVFAPPARVETIKFGQVPNLPFFMDFCDSHCLISEI